MPEEIEINHCALCKPIDRNEAKYQTDIIATNCVWKESLDTNNSLQTSPVTGQSHFVTLKSPVKFWLQMELWLYYDSPAVALNGYETEQDVAQSKFCYGQIVSIISHNESAATVQFAIKHTMTFQEILATRPAKELPGFWTAFCLPSLKEDDYSLIALGKYVQLNVSAAQGDIGLSFILTEIGSDYFICKINHWSFHEEYTFGGKYILPAGVKEKIFG